MLIFSFILLEAISRIFETKKMRYITLLSICLLFACSSDNQKVEGKVTNEEGKALSEVLVQVMGTDLYTYTDEQGYFAINTKSRGNELIFNFEGYKLGRYDVSEDEPMQVSLEALPPKVEAEAKEEKDSILD